MAPSNVRTRSASYPEPAVTKLGAGLGVGRDARGVAIGGAELRGNGGDSEAGHASRTCIEQELPAQDAVRRTTSTGHGAWRARLSATLPSMARRIPRRPWVPQTIRSAR